MALEELEATGQHWDHNAVMGPPTRKRPSSVPPYAPCPCMYDARPCLRCWALDQDNGNSAERDDEDDSEHFSHEEAEEFFAPYGL